jgi:tripartite-type tricarboxylate transporter receptor subunit TctC
VPALQDNLGQPVVIENRGGAGGIIGTEVLAKAAPDGYTLLLVYVSHATNPTLAAKQLTYDTLRDFAPITLVSHEPTVLVTHPSVPANTLAEFIAYAKARGGKLSYATDPGSAGFLAGELFKQKTGMTNIEYVPYKGSGPAAADVVAGHLPYMWSVISIVTPFIKGGRLKGLAIAAESRAPGLPDVPTTAEGGIPDFQVSGWYGLVAPAKTPKAVIDRVHAAAVKALKDEAVLQRLATSGSLPIGAGPAELDAHIRSEIARWDKVLKAAGVELK